MFKVLKSSRSLRLLTFFRPSISTPQLTVTRSISCSHRGDQLQVAGISTGPTRHKSALKVISDEIVVDICEDIKRRFRRKILIDAFVSDEEQTKIVRLLLTSKVSPESIREILPEQPVLLKHSSDVWAETIALLKSYGFGPSHYLALISESPGLLRGSTRKSLSNILAQLTSFGIPDGKRQAIVVGNSALLLHDDAKQIQKCLGHLLSVFTKSEVQKIITTTPKILTDSWQETRQKIEYIYEDMGIRSREITKYDSCDHVLYACCVLNH